MILVGFDVGGTFTDVVGYEKDSRRFLIAKVPTSGSDPSAGCISGLEKLDIPLSSIDGLVHGTTVGTNAVLQRNGARIGLITTGGFRDILELGRRTRPHLFGLLGEFKPLVPRELRFEVPERLDARGNVITPLDEDAVRGAVKALLDAGAEALVIHFLHSYVNPMHERRAGEIARELWPNPFITLGSDVLPEVREYERGTAGAVNAYLQPVLARYLGKLGSAFRERGYDGKLLIMQGNGGVMDEGISVESSIQTVMSGPAAGAIAAARIGSDAGFPNVIGCDMGGTSFDVSLIEDGQPHVSAEKDIAYAMPVYLPMIDIHSIGSGGGSIASVNKAGLLSVGPRSAGSYPGPICYGRGGEHPTVTDANYLLGRIDISALPGGMGQVEEQKVRTAFKTQLADPLGLSVEEAAAAVIRVVNTQMADAIRLISVEQGRDPRDFAILSFGGAGSLHTVALADELGVPAVIVPRFPGLTSALGCVLADIRHDFVNYVRRPLADVTPEETDAIFATRRKEGIALVESESRDTTGVDVVYEADLFYDGQSHFFRVPVASPGFSSKVIAADLASRYRQKFGLELSNMRPMIGNLRTTVIGRRPDVDLRLLSAGKVVSDEGRSRPVFLGGRWQDTRLLRRESLASGDTVAGPAIVEQLDTTVLVEPGHTARVDGYSNLIITRNAEQVQ